MPAGIKTSNFLQELDGVFVPATKGLDDERLKGDALGRAVFKVGAVFGGLPHLDSSSGRIGSVVEDGVLGWRDNADVKSHSLPINPVGDVNVRGARLGIEDEAGAFLWSG